MHCLSSLRNGFKAIKQKFVALRAKVSAKMQKKSALTQPAAPVTEPAPVLAPQVPAVSEILAKSGSIIELYSLFGSLDCLNLDHHQSKAPSASMESLGIFFDGSLNEQHHEEAAWGLELLFASFQYDHEPPDNMVPSFGHDALFFEHEEAGLGLVNLFAESDQDVSLYLDVLFAEAEEEEPYHLDLLFAECKEEPFYLDVVFAECEEEPLYLDVLFAQCEEDEPFYLDVLFDEPNREEQLRNAMIGCIVRICKERKLRESKLILACYQENITDKAETNLALLSRINSSLPFDSWISDWAAC